MNKAEISEIKKQFSPDRCAIEKICTCYVGNEREKSLMSREAFLSLPEEEMYKYLAFFKKALTGVIGKNVINLEFPLSEELEDGRQTRLYRLLKSKLEDDGLLEEFYDRIIENYDNGGKYLILLISAVYDVPGKGKDNIELDDASDTMYSFIFCCVCPVELSKGELGYDPARDRIGELTQNWVVQAPDKGFLFPSFNDRASDLHELLYYSKKADDIQPEFIDAMFGIMSPLTAADQQDTFNALVSSTMGEEGDVSTMKNLHETLEEMAEDNEDNPEPVALSSPEVKKILQLSGIPDRNLEGFENRFEDIAGEDAQFMISNISNRKKFTIATPDIEIKVNPEYLDRIEARLVDGKECIVIEVDDHVVVNGVSVRTIANGTS